MRPGGCPERTEISPLADPIALYKIYAARPRIAGRGIALSFMQIPASASGDYARGVPPINQRFLLHLGDQLSHRPPTPFRGHAKNVRDFPTRDRGRATFFSLHAAERPRSSVARAVIVTWTV